MGLLDGGIAELFGDVFAEHFLPATLHKVSIVRQAGGSLSSEVTDYNCLAQLDGSSQGSADAPQITTRIIVLATSLEVVPTIDDEITFQGSRYTISNSSPDGARSHYVLNGHFK